MLRRLKGFKNSSYKDYNKYVANRDKSKKNSRIKLKKYVESLKKPCLFCGSDEKLQFHHVNPTEKEHLISSLHNWSKKSIDEEISKCWCLCESCHRKLHQRAVDPLPSAYDHRLSGRATFDPVTPNTLDAFFTAL